MARMLTAVMVWEMPEDVSLDNPSEALEELPVAVAWFEVDTTLDIDNDLGCAFKYGYDLDVLEENIGRMRLKFLAPSLSGGSMSAIDGNHIVVSWPLLTYGRS